MSAVLSVALGLLRRVPPLAWVLLALLAWGGWQKHQADARARALQQREQAEAQQRADAIRDALLEQTRRAAAQGKIVDEATEQTRRLATDRDAARAAADAALRRLRDQRAAALADAGASAPAAGGSAPAGDAELVPAQLLGRCAARVLELADIADQRGTAGTACERAYDALTLAPGAGN